MGVHASFGRIKISLKWQYEIVCNSWIIISYVMEKEVLVLMLLSVFSLMSVALSPTKNYILERQMLDACGIQAIANISRMQWQSSKDHVLRGYDFAYDGLNRLEESTYAEGADMSQNKSSFDNNQNPTFHYYEKDHLGSIRMVVNENGTIEQVNHYYPFGGVYGNLSYNAEIQKSKYIGKEFDHMHGLDLYDHGARMYDAAKVSWDRVDRLGEKYTQLSPYLYCASNPVVFLDADGCKVSLSGDSVNVERFVNLLNEGVGQQVFRFDHSSRTILYTASSKPNLYEKDIANIVNSNDYIIINVVSNSERVLIGDWLKKRVDVNDMESLNDYEGTSGAAAAYHELL